MTKKLWLSRADVRGNIEGGLRDHPIVITKTHTQWDVTALVHTVTDRIRILLDGGVESAYVNLQDPGNTRTVLPSWWERLLIAPNRVGFHLEHHLLMTVPHYHLPRMNRMLRQRGVLDDACVERSYWSVLRRAG